jgi:hypothetical protein
MLDFNTEPYYDDYNEDKKFYKILFRPGYPVQARELTQLQTIVQQQVKRHGDHIFKQGSMVIPGEFAVDTKYNYIKVDPTYGGVDVNDYLDSFIGKQIVGATSGITAEVLYATAHDNTDPATLFVRYITSDNSSASVPFSNSEVISLADETHSVQSISTNATGIGSAGIIKRGVYYINGFFVLADSQTVILDKYSNIPSYRIGLTINESVITEYEDESLLDNAQNSYNYSAPGSHRHFIDLVLSKLPIGTTTDSNFIELARVVNGRILSIKSGTDYAQLEKTLAERTYDESGDYIVVPFGIDVREHRNNDRSNWISDRLYLLGDIVSNSSKLYTARNTGTSAGSTGPTHTVGKVYDGTTTGVQWEYTPKPNYNRGVYDSFGSVISIEVTKQGSGFLTAPTISFSGGGGIGASASAKINSEGKLIGIDVINIGSGFTSNPNVIITSDSGTNAEAVAYANFGNEAKLAIGMEAGKAYVQGYKIQKPSTEFVDVDKARTYNSVNNAKVSATVGNYVFVKNLAGIPDYKNNVTINIYDQLAGAGNIIGTCKVRGVEWDNGLVYQTTTIYKLFIFDISMRVGKNFSRDTKSFAISGFVADISPNLTQLLGTITGSTTSLTGTGTNFLSVLRVGDYLYIAGQVKRVTVITSNSAITIDSSPSVAITGSTFSLLSTDIVEPNNSGLIFPLPNSFIKASSDISYTVFERFAALTVASGQVAFQTTDTGTFASAAAYENYLLSTTSAIVPITGIVVAGNQVTISVNASYNGQSVILSAAINKTGATSTRRTKTATINHTEYTTATLAQATTLNLGYADTFRVLSIKMKSGTFAAPTGNYTIDISDRYDFDDGQRETHYDYSRLTLKSSFSPPTAPVQVYFEYFAHGTGDYFTVESYTGIGYNEIPTYTGFSLRDVIDFRPAYNGSSWTSTTFLPKRAIDVNIDYDYYLPRLDKIYIDYTGNFVNVKGTPNIPPLQPPVMSTGMELYSLTLAPYTLNTTIDNVIFTKAENKRYTMRDIGKLEKRIENLEYYTSLSLLEQETVSMKITDTSGLDRFQNGFIVDSFNGHGIGNTLSPDYLCAIDQENNQLRPFYTMQNINIIEKNKTEGARTSNSYKMYGDIITLPVIDHVKIAEQTLGSRTERINPFAIFTFLGNMELTPSSDDWFETERRPDIINNVEGNFNTIKVLGEASGVMGTIWNAWQTQWSGKPVITNAYSGGLAAQAQARGLTGQSFSLNGHWSLYGGSYTLTTTTATTKGQYRSGVNTTLVAKVDTQLTEDRIVSSAVIPYIRSRNVLIQAKALKPETEFYPFFENMDISNYCTPATKLDLGTSVSGIFDYASNVGGDSSNAQRRINGDTQVCLNRGDIIFVSLRGSTAYQTPDSSGCPATAVIVDIEYNPTTLHKSIYVVNIKGSFLSGDVVKGNVSLAYGTLTATPVAKVKGNSVITNFNGSANLLFDIPNTDSVRFRTGKREFKLQDTATPLGLFNSRGTSMYEANGVLQTKQATYTATRNGELVQERLEDNRVITETSERVVSGTGWYDPLAQTFTIKDQPGGCFLTKVDIFFAKKDPSIPVTLQIRETVNGYPGATILPFSSVTLLPEQINLSSTIVTVTAEEGGNVPYPKYDTPTTFNFKSPVYVKDGTDYAIVLLSDSILYRVWISEMGNLIPDSTQTISQQPYAGVLYKSQNGQSWTPCDTQDMKFTVYRAKFDVNAVGSIDFINDVIPTTKITIDSFDAYPFQTTSGSALVRVWHQDHGMPSGSIVRISGVANTINGITAANLNGDRTIANVDMDSYTITAGGNASSSGYAGPASSSEVWLLSKNIQYDAIQPSFTNLNFPETSIDYKIRTASGKSVDGFETPYVIDAASVACVSNDTNYFNSPRMIVSEVNESNAGLNGIKPLTLTATIKTTKDSLSPIIDTHRVSSVLIANKINKPYESNTNLALIDEVSVFTGVGLTFNTKMADTVYGNAFISSTDVTFRGKLKAIAIGTYITIAGTTSSLNNGTFLVSHITDDGTTGKLFVSFVDSVLQDFTSQVSLVGTTIVNKVMFKDDITPVGSSTVSKYVSNNIILNQVCGYLKINFSANVPLSSDVFVYYKAIKSGDINALNWVKIEPAAPVIKTDLSDFTFTDYHYNVETDNIITVDTISGVSGTNTIVIPTTVGVSIGSLVTGVGVGTASLITAIVNGTGADVGKSTLTMSVVNASTVQGSINIHSTIGQFDTVAVKLVMQSTNTCAIPTVKDLRIIACA